VLNDTEAVIERTVRMINEKMVETVTGKIIPIEADTVCIHGDNEKASVLVSSLAEALRKRGIELKYFAKQ
jgi:UPF0271 protein